MRENKLSSGIVSGHVVVEVVQEIRTHVDDRFLSLGIVVIERAAFRLLRPVPIKHWLGNVEFVEGFEANLLWIVSADFII